jgi:hypothetical protein
MYIVYYLLDEFLKRTYNSETKEFQTVQQLPESCNQFYMPAKKYKSTDEDLIKYSNDLLESNNQYKSYYKFKGYKQPFDYITEFKKKTGGYFYKTHSWNIIRFFKIFTNADLFDKIIQEVIKKEESSWSLKCNNGGLIYSDVGTYQCYGYDFKNFYAQNLSSESFKFPIKSGLNTYIDSIPAKLKNIKVGYYNVIISCNHKNFKKVFAISKYDVYTHYDLIFAIRLKKQFDIEIKLNKEVKYNCYLYKDEDIITGNVLFKEWYDTIVELKELYPKNVITKLLSSSLWGHLCQGNYVFKNKDEKDKLNWGTDPDGVDYLFKERNYNADGTHFYKFQKMDEPYKYNIRIKSFLTAFGRNKTAWVVLEENPDSVLRIHTDGIIFNKKLEDEYENFIEESDKTGMLKLPLYSSSS